MVDDRLATVEGSSVSDGSTGTLVYEDNEPHTVEAIQVIEESGTTLDATTGTLSIKGDTFTDQVVPLAALQENYRDLFKFNVELPSNTELELSFTNANGGSVTVNLVLYFAMGGGMEG
jgi:hypothetical protein